MKLYVVSIVKLSTFDVKVWGTFDTVERAQEEAAFDAACDDLRAGWWHRRVYADDGLPELAMIAYDGAVMTRKYVIEEIDLRTEQRVRELYGVATSPRTVVTVAML